jgi:Mrp family chromosome partitioning ATPase
VAVALAAATFVLLGFVAYWAFAPTAFRATAQVVLATANGTPVALPSSPPPAAKLRAAAIDATTVEKARAALEPGTTAAAAHAQIDSALQVQNDQPNTFDFTFVAGTAAQSKQFADLFASRAAELAPQLFAPPPPDRTSALEAVRTQNAAALANFVNQHPELTAQSPVVAPLPAKEGADKDPAALRAERDQIQAKLARLPEAAPGSDNPFGEPSLASAEAARMRRRLTEIDIALKARQKAERKSDAAPKIAPEIANEWKRLVEAVAHPTVPAAAAGPALRATVRQAPLPSDPIYPDRHGLTLLGGAMTLFTFAVFALGLSLTRRRSPGRPVSLPPDAARTPSDRPLFGSEPPAAPYDGRLSSSPPRPSSEPPRESDAPPQFGSEPPRAGSEPPRAGSEPPRAGSEPPRAGSEPPRAGSEPPRAGSEPPRAGSEPPRAGSEPPRVSSSPPRAGSAPGAAQVAAARPIVPVGITSVNAPDAGRTSSNPPARPSSIPAAARPSSSPPGKPSSHPSAREAKANPLAATAPAVPVPASEPPPATVAGGLTAPSPPPPPPAPSSSPPHAAASSRQRASLAKTTLLGLPPLEQRELAATAASPAAADAGPPPEVDRGSPVSPPRGSRAPRTTVRPPPSDPNATGSTHTVSAEVIVPPRERSPGANRSAAAGTEPPPDSWTGPSRAHRRSMSARRTTQVLGSPIPPAARTSRPPDARSSTSPQPRGNPPTTPTTYSYVSTRPEEAPPRPPTDTPPYYQIPRAENASLGQPRIETPRMPTAVDTPAVVPPQILTRHVRDGWIPDPSLDFRARRTLSDQLFPLAMEGCFVVGVTAVDEARDYKSRVAAELALALAEPRHPRVLLLETDFQWPAVHRTLRVEMPMSLGFSQQLSARGEPPTWTVIECSPTLHVLAEGIMRSPGLILSVRFEQSIQSLRGYYDFIVMDGPLASAEIDAHALASVTDGGIVVSPAKGSPDLGRACGLFADKRFSTVLGV